MSNLIIIKTTKDMKKIFLSSLMLLSMTLMFTAFDDDRDSNPTLSQPTTFALNNP